MPVDEYLLERIDKALHRRRVQWVGKKMFGGYCYMVDDKMCIGFYQGGLMARVGPDAVEQLTKREGATQMVHGGRPMKGYLRIDPAGYDSEADLEFWIDRCLAFNPEAKASRKR
ncbi:MAG: TfoX/Sxy family protein [Flavobacteriales bacterium]|nr:TfoX/Sxy family protein [Flavobacteriales bacterium]MCB9166857.1 TfoX/Sxy family protein [Flavobacteriales bacterium]